MTHTLFRSSGTSSAWGAGGILFLALGLVSPASWAAFDFRASGDWLGNSDSYSVAMGDLDGDGDLDAFVAGASGPSGVWINQGGDQGGSAGTYAAPDKALGTGDSRDVALADLDGDGDLDAFVANYNDPNTVWINDGSGNFTDSGQSLGNYETEGVALADIDGDGDQDAVAVADYGDRSWVWVNDGNGGFTGSEQTLGYRYCQDVTLGDVDGDGNPDAVVARDYDSSVVWLNDGNGGFTDSGQTLGGDSFGVALADLDGDDDLDLVVAGRYDNLVWLNQGGSQGGTAGTFADSGQTLGGGAFGVALADLNGDGATDIFFADSNANTVWLNDATGTFTDAGQSLGDANSRAVALGDTDGDGDADAFVANLNGLDSVWSNDSSGTFAASQSLGRFGYSQEVAVADLDGDGDTDAFVAKASSNSVLLRDASGSLADSGQVLGGSDSEDVALADLDGDGDTDAFVTNYGEPDTVWMNQGGDQGGAQGELADSGQALDSGGVGSRSVALADLDGDGDQDAFVANESGSPNIVWVNDGSGGFTDSTQTLGTGNSRDVALADLDGDGDTDAFVANYGEPDTVWINQGGTQGGTKGELADSGQTLGSYQSQAVALGDLDGDGDADALVGTDDDYRIWINLGGDQGGDAGTFAESGQAQYGDYTDVSLTDLDGDGDLDAILGSWDSPAVLVNQGGYQGNALGYFEAIHTPNAGAPNLALLDSDAKGEVDFLSANGHYDRIYRNNSPGLIRFETAEYVVDPAAGSVTLSVERNGGSSGPVSVDYATIDGTALAVTDYTGAFDTLSWSDGESDTKSITVDITDDGETEEEFFEVALEYVTGDGNDPEPELVNPDTATVTIQPAGLGGAAPSFTGGTGFFAVREDAPIGTEVTTLAATDPDGDPVTFAITSGNEAGKFAVVETTGKIFVADSLDYETTESYTLTVEANDGYSGSGTATGTVTINVNNVAEGDGGGGCTLDAGGNSHPGILALLGLLGVAGLMRRRIV